MNCEMEGRLKNLNSSPSKASDFIMVNDLSEGGIRFRINHFFPVRQRFYFNLQVPHGAAIESAGELAWIREIPHLNCYEAGAKFVDFPAQRKNLLHRFIFERL